MRIGIIGYYGFHNLGDELNLQCLMNNLREQFKSVEFLVFSDCRKLEGEISYKIVGLNYIPSPGTRIQDVMNSCDLLIIGGGGLIYLGEFWFAFMDENITAPYIIYRVGIDDREVNREAVEAHRNLFLRAKEVTVRDHYSQELCRKYLMKHAEVVPEAIWNHPYKNIQLYDRPAKKVGINLRSFAPEIFPVLQNFFDYLREQGYRLHFIPCQVLEQNPNLNDNKYHRLEADKEDIILPEDSSYEERCRLISEMDFCIGMRLHFVLLSLSQRVPVIALNYNNKVKSLMDEVFLNDFIVDFVGFKEEITSEQLRKIFHRILQNSGDIRSHINHRVAVLEKEAKKQIMF